MESISVYIRPRFSSNMANTTQTPFIIKDNTITSLKSNETFLFNKVFPLEESNSEIFNSNIQPHFKNLFKGINMSIFCYGQTSSGKTFTMQGNQIHPGIIPNSLNELFNIKSRKNENLEISISYMEIYNEILNDLLDLKKRNLEIRESREIGIFVENITETTVDNLHSAMKLFEQGDNNKIMGETKLNQNSSRSHTIFRINIKNKEIQEDGTPVTYISQLNLIDLAGSENASISDSKIRFKEGSNINKSLLSLSIVINKLSTDNRSFINYRDSKLTRLLQTALSGNSKTFIICNIALNTEYYSETMNTINFGLKAKNIKTCVKINEIVDEKLKIISENANLKSKIRSLEGEIQKKEEMLKSFSRDDFSFIDETKNNNLISNNNCIVSALEKEVEIIKKYLSNSSFKKQSTPLRLEDQDIKDETYKNSKIRLFNGDSVIRRLDNFEEINPQTTAKKSSFVNLNSTIKLNKYERYLTDAEYNQNKLENEIEKLRDESKCKDDKIKNLSENIQELERKVKEQKDFSELIYRLRSENEEINKKFEDISDKYKTLKINYEKELSKTLELDYINTKLVNEQKNLNIKINELSNELTFIKNEKTRYERDMSQTDEYYNMKIENSKIKFENFGLKKKIEDLEKTSKIVKFMELEKLISDKTETVHSLETEINTLKIKILRIESQNEGLEFENSRLMKESSLNIRELKKNLYSLEKKNLVLERIQKKENSIFRTESKRVDTKNKTFQSAIKKKEISEFHLLSEEKETTKFENEFIQKKRKMQFK